MTIRITVTNHDTRRSVEVLARGDEARPIGELAPGETRDFYVWQGRDVVVREPRDAAAEAVPTRHLPEISPQQIVPSAPALAS